MKIALIRSAVHRSGGVERYVWLLARELARRGHEVHLIARRCPELPDPRVRLHPVRVRGPFSFLKVRSFAAGARGVLARERFDIVHACDRVPGGDIYRAGEGLHREWMRVSARYLSPWRRALRACDPLHAVLLRAERRIFAEGGARRVTAISRRGAGEIRAHFGLAEVPVIYNGVDPEEFRPPGPGEREAVRAEIGAAAEDFLVLYVGSGFFRKGLRYLIEGLARLETRPGESVRLAVSGRGGEGPCRRRARRLGVAGRVRFLGTAVPPARLYRAADLFVFPTLYEPFGNVCLEALASGLPCVFSARSGGAEIIAEGREGFILRAPDDPAEIARLIRAGMDADRAGMGRAARALALRFSVAANAEATEALYREVLAEKERAR